jgi:glycosyltransferase involved in cell wall biosynthesis
MVAIHTILGTWRTKVDWYIALSGFAKEKFRKSVLSIPEDRLIVKPNFVQDSGMGDSIRKDFFLFIGRLVEEKGIQVLLKAATLHNHKITIIGDGPLRERVEAAAKANPNIRYLGFQDKLSIMTHLKKCRALIFPSIWYEGFPITILEAFSTGTVVIASKLGVMNEVIQNRVNGLLFEAGNESDLVAKMDEVTAQQAWAKCLSDNARLTYLIHYTPEKNYNLLINIYNKALSLKRQEQSKLVHQPVPQLHVFPPLHLGEGSGGEIS